MMKIHIFNLFTMGAGDLACASDESIPMSKHTRLCYNLRGRALTALLGWLI